MNLHTRLLITALVSSTLFGCGSGSVTALDNTAVGQILNRRGDDATTDSIAAWANYATSSSIIATISSSSGGDPVLSSSSTDPLSSSSSIVESSSSVLMPSSSSIPDQSSSSINIPSSSSINIPSSSSVVLPSSSSSVIVSSSSSVIVSSSSSVVVSSSSGGGTGGLEYTASNQAQEIPAGSSVITMNLPSGWHNTTSGSCTFACNVSGPGFSGTVDGVALSGDYYVTAQIPILSTINGYSLEVTLPSSATCQIGW